VDIPAYMSKIREGDLAGAAGILLNFNPLPAITGRVCPHFCESECNRTDLDEPVSIRSVERTIGDFILEYAGEIIKPPESETGKSVAIAGSGPAGLTAAYYLRRIGNSVTVFEVMDEPGGMLTYGIPPYRLPKDVVRKQVKALEGMGIQLKLSTDAIKDNGIEGLMESYDAVFLACGAWKERQSGIAGEQLMMSGTEFLRNSNLGIREVPGKKVAVIGGGNVAIDVARTLLRLGAEPVVMYRRSRAEMPAVKEEVEKAEQEGIDIQFLTLPVEVTRQDKILLLRCTRMELGLPDETGRPRPVPKVGSEFEAEFDAAITAIGEEANTSIIPGEFLDKGGRLKVDESGHYLGKNVFAGGDFVTGPSTVVEAVAAGRQAADSIDRYLGGKGIQPEEKDGETPELPARFNSSYLRKTARVQTPELPVAERIKSIDIEDTGSLGLSETEEEANRCFNCGCVAVNSSDMAPVLIALGAKIRTSRRVIEAENFFAVDGNKTTVLDDDEIVTEIEIPAPGTATRSSFIKFAIRKSIDFPIVNCAAVIESENGVVRKARICLNSVYNTPYRATGAEDYITSKKIDDSNAEAAAEAAVADACALIDNKYKIQIAKTLVKRAILACNSMP